nr:MAG TPA: hypothetical protein [Caudoviricetes sp.]
MCCYFLCLFIFCAKISIAIKYISNRIYSIFFGKLSFNL